MEPVIKVLLAYLIGSVSGALLLGRLRKVDIRTMGSGNAGGTNALRTQGMVFALAVVVIDIGKGALAVGVIPWLDLPWLTQAPVTGRIVMACGMAAILGHCFPAWHGFRGGKGAATTVGVLAVINPLLLIPMLATWLVSLALTGYVGLATVLAGFSLIPAAIYLSDSPELIRFAIFVALFMAFTHRANIKYTVRGTENRFERARIVNWFRKSGSAGTEPDEGD